MKYGAMQYLLGTQEQLFEAAAAMGLDGVELGYGDANDLATNPDRRRVTGIQAQANGIEIPSLCIGSLNNGGFSNDDPTVRQRALDLVTSSLDAALELGAKVILVPFFFKGSPENDEQFQRIVEHFRQVAPLAEAKGLTFGYEGDLSADRMLALLEQVGSPALKCYYDIGNAVWLGHDPLAEIPLLGAAVCQVHIKEFYEKLSDRMLGEGKVPVPGCCDALRALGYDGYLVLETATFKDPMTNTPAQLAYLRQFI